MIARRTAERDLQARRAGEVFCGDFSPDAFRSDRRANRSMHAPRTRASIPKTRAPDRRQPCRVMSHVIELPITPPRSSAASCAALHCEFAQRLSFNFPSCTPISTATNLRRMRDAMHGCYVDSAGLRLVVCDKSAAESRRGRHRCFVAHHASKNQRTLMGKHAAPPASIAGASSSHHLTRRHRHRSPAQPAARSCLYYGRRDS